MTFSHSEDDYRNVGLKVYPETKEAKWDRVRRNYGLFKTALANETRAGSLVCDIVATHNFFVEKISLTIDPDRVPNGEDYCCITSFCLEKPADAEQGSQDQIKTTLMLSGNDDHVTTKVAH